MSQKTVIYIGLFIGSTIGGFIPTLWGDSMFSISAVLLSGVGGIAGIVAGYKLTS
jgi:dipeptide/tripeptide permease